jgi:hypothetical protein
MALRSPTEEQLALAHLQEVNGSFQDFLLLEEIHYLLCKKCKVKLKETLI